MRPLPCEEMCDGPEGKNGRGPGGAGPASPSSFPQKHQIIGTQGNNKTTTPWTHLHQKCGEALTKAVGNPEIQILARLLAITSWKFYSFNPWLIFMAASSKSKGQHQCIPNICRHRCIFSKKKKNSEIRSFEN